MPSVKPMPEYDALREFCYAQANRGLMRERLTRHSRARQICIVVGTRGHVRPLLTGGSE